MTDHPISFSAPMIRAILAGRKTQTRRVILRPERYDNIGACDFCCPFGQPGDRLWVRETWATEKYLDHMKPSELGDAATIPLWYQAIDSQLDRPGQVRGKWRPSIFMPHWASRIRLVLTQVKVQQLREITPESAVHEGILPAEEYAHLPSPLSLKGVITGFALLWDSLNAKRGYGWDTNPWVWVLTWAPL